jgi:hypothetical protein
MAKSLRRPPVKGTADPQLPGHVLVPVRKPVAGFPKVNYSVPDTSYWRVNTKTNRPTAILTMTPDGVSLGWDNCGTCGMGIAVCDCSMGISLPNSIGYIFVSRGGIKPLPLPNSVVFKAPLTQPFKSKRSLKRKGDGNTQPRTPKRTLKRSKQDEADAKEAEAIIERTYRSLKR